MAAGAIAKKILINFDVTIAAYMTQIGKVRASLDYNLDVNTFITARDANPVFCPDATAALNMQQAIADAKAAGDSLGGVIEFHVTNSPVGLGDPVYEKLESNLARAMLTIPATKGFEIGEGFAAAAMLGSEHNDAFQESKDNKVLRTNHAGGTLGGISTGMPIVGRVAFKPTSSIMKKQQTIDQNGNAQAFNLPAGSRHDPCVAIRAVPIVEAMCALVLVDSMLMQRCTQLK